MKKFDYFFVLCTIECNTNVLLASGYLLFDQYCMYFLTNYNENVQILFQLTITARILWNNMKTEELNHNYWKLNENFVFTLLDFKSFSSGLLKLKLHFFYMVNKLIKFNFRFLNDYSVRQTWNEKETPA